MNDSAQEKRIIGHVIGQIQNKLVETTVLLIELIEHDKCSEWLLRQPHQKGQHKDLT